MPVESHIDSLKTRHQELEQQIQDMRSTASTSEIDITDLKRKKLHLKDRIQQLSTEQPN